jgi:hypothetical protein
MMCNPASQRWKESTVNCGFRQTTIGQLIVVSSGLQAQTESVFGVVARFGIFFKDLQPAFKSRSRKRTGRAVFNHPAWVAMTERFIDKCLYWFRYSEFLQPGGGFRAAVELAGHDFLQEAAGGVTVAGLIALQEGDGFQEGAGVGIERRDAGEGVELLQCLVVIVLAEVNKTGEKKCIGVAGVGAGKCGEAFEGKRERPVIVGGYPELQGVTGAAHGLTEVVVVGMDILFGQLCGPGWFYQEVEGEKEQDCRCRGRNRDIAGAESG